jgi:hypothetical protein
MTTRHRADGIDESQQHEAESKGDPYRAKNIDPADSAPDGEEDQDERTYKFSNELFQH